MANVDYQENGVRPPMSGDERSVFVRFWNAMKDINRRRRALHGRGIEFSEVAERAFVEGILHARRTDAKKQHDHAISDAYARGYAAAEQAIDTRIVQTEATRAAHEHGYQKGFKEAQAMFAPGDTLMSDYERQVRAIAAAQVGPVPRWLDVPMVDKDTGSIVHRRVQNPEYVRQLAAKQAEAREAVHGKRFVGEPNFNAEPKTTVVAQWHANFTTTTPDDARMGYGHGGGNVE